MSYIKNENGRDKLISIGRVWTSFTSIWENNCTDKGQYRYRILRVGHDVEDLTKWDLKHNVIPSLEKQLEEAKRILAEMEKHFESYLW